MIERFHQGETSMESPAPSAVPDTVLLGLAKHLRLTDSNLSVEQAATLAILEWQAAHGGASTPADANELRGYQWKTLFLPESTTLRLIYGCNSHYARVEGDHLVYQGCQVSPRQFAMMVTNSVRNAWRELWIRFPDSRDWKNAHACRAEQRKNSRQLPISPAETMQAAAASMADALRSALALVEHSNAETVTKFEQRLAPTRRAVDRVHEDCAFDS